MKEKLRFEGITLFVVFILLPLLAICSIRVFEYLVPLNQFFYLLGMICLIAINISIMYYIARVMMVRLKMPLTYFIVNGLIFILLILFGCIYYQYFNDVACFANESRMCAFTITSKRLFNMALIMSSCYYAIFMTLSIINSSKEEIKEEKKKRKIVRKTK